MSLHLFDLPPPIIHARDKWGTPPGVYRAPLRLLGAERYDVDFAAGDGAKPVDCREHWDVARDSLRNPWDYETPTLGWLNFPFSDNLGGKTAWVSHAIAQVLAHPVLLAFYGPATPDAAMVALSYSRALLTRIEVTPRVHHIPPPGIEASSPNQVPHAIWLLGGDWVQHRWHHPRLMVWDWRAESWLTDGVPRVKSVTWAQMNGDAERNSIHRQGRACGWLVVDGHSLKCAQGIVFRGAPCVCGATNDNNKGTT